MPLIPARRHPWLLLTTILVTCIKATQNFSFYNYAIAKDLLALCTWQSNSKPTPLACVKSLITWQFIEVHNPYTAQTFLHGVCSLPERRV